jgi:hypothetical protein
MGKPKAKAKNAISSDTKGCCTITFDDKKDEQIEGITKAECVKRARARGGVGQWNKGKCA